MSVLGVTLFGFTFSGTLAIIVVVGVVVVLAGLFAALRGR